MLNLLTLHSDRVLQPPLAPDARALGGKDWPD